MVINIRNLESALRGFQAGMGRFELERAVTTAILRALASDPGDLLVFLPGVGEIRAVERMLATTQLPTSGKLPVKVLPLHGMLSPQEQDRAVQPEPGACPLSAATDPSGLTLVKGSQYLNQG